MRPDDIQKLLGGYATGTLTEAEQQALFAAALENQELFDALAREQGLHDMLRDPAARAHLLAALDEPSRWSAFWRPVAVLAMAGLAAVSVFVLRPHKSAPPAPAIVAEVRPPAPPAVPAAPAPEPTRDAPPRRADLPNARNLFNRPFLPAQPVPAPPTLPEMPKPELPTQGRAFSGAVGGVIGGALSAPPAPPLPAPQSFVQSADSAPSQGQGQQILRDQAFAVPLTRNVRAAALSGHVTDATGAAIPNATVNAVNAANQTATAKTDAAGAYSLPSLAPGNYQLVATAPGFKTNIREAVVDPANPVGIDLRLDVGATAETVEVASSTTPVKSDRRAAAPSFSAGPPMLRQTASGVATFGTTLGLRYTILRKVGDAFAEADPANLKRTDTLALRFTAETNGYLSVAGAAPVILNPMQPYTTGPLPNRQNEIKVVFARQPLANAAPTGIVTETLNREMHVAPATPGAVLSFTITLKRK